MTEASFALPWPPSVNGMYRNLSGVGRVKTKAYGKWETEAGWQLKSQKPPRLTGPVRLRILFGPKPGRWDMSNFIKPVEDLLVSYGVIPDDNSKVITRIVCAKGPNIKEGILVHLASSENEEALS